MAGCGPDGPDHVDEIDASWAVGSYSSVRDGIASSDLLNVDVDADGTVTFTRRTSCTGADSATTSVFEWVADGTESIRISDPGGGLIEGESHLWLAKTEQCDMMMLRAPSGAGSSDFLQLHVGATCLVYQGPCDSGGECEECVAKWCGEPPVSCE